MSSVGRFSVAYNVPRFSKRVEGRVVVVLVYLTGRLSVFMTDKVVDSESTGLKEMKLGAAGFTVLGRARLKPLNEYPLRSFARPMSVFLIARMGSDAVIY